MMTKILQQSLFVAKCGFYAHNDVSYCAPTRALALIKKNTLIIPIKIVTRTYQGKDRRWMEFLSGDGTLSLLYIGNNDDISMFFEAL